ncbi:MAG: archaetidylserine decarboxylase [Puniceicoccales bacterium]|jgi:phosphatidylserine decarboxylase|nr:archaetidylserine decarboxylase [Puniceicoccales bacterium]
MQDITIFNRYTNKLEHEAIFGKKFLIFAYCNALGRLTISSLIKRKIFSILYGKYADSQISARQIKPFIEKFGIKTDSLEKKVEDFTSFNDFFCRKLKPSARPISPDPTAVAAPADGRMLAFKSIANTTPFFVKGEQISVADLTKDYKLASKFRNCSMLISRLCPTDYHYFHFPVDCIPQRTYLINGEYSSIHPFAMKGKFATFLQNKRMSTVLQTKLCGQILMIEIGATCVGSIQQTFTPFQEALKGAEKGYFQFGGSTVILLFERDRIKFSEDLLANTQDGIETYVMMGDKIAIIV